MTSLRQLNTGHFPASFGNDSRLDSLKECGAVSQSDCRDREEGRAWAVGTQATSHSPAAAPVKGSPPKKPDADGDGRTEVLGGLRRASYALNTQALAVDENP